jgi:hypothetical protein
MHTFAWLVGLNPVKHSLKTCFVCLQISVLMEEIHHSHVCTVKSIDVVYKSNVSWGICQPSMFSKTFLFNLAAEYTDHKYESSAPDPENLKDMKWRIMN